MGAVHQWRTLCARKPVRAAKRIWELACNTVLQSALNPNKVSVSRGGTEFRLGDKVMQRINNYTKSCWNDDSGIITAIDTEDKTVYVNFDGRQEEYDISELDELMLSYAVTIHKSQGSEYPIVLIPL